MQAIPGIWPLRPRSFVQSGRRTGLGTVQIEEEPPDPAVPVSELGLFLGIEFAPGADVATLTLPIAADGVAEPEEGVVIVLEGFGDPVVPEPIELTGVVPPG